MSNLINIVGLDPSLSNFGIAECTLNLDTLNITVAKLSVAKTEPEADKKKRKVVRKNSEDLDRAKVLHVAAMEAVKGKALAFVEIPVGSQTARSMASYGVCIGVLASVNAAVPMVQVTPTEVKLAGCGIKTATKGEMIEAMMIKYPDAGWPMQTQKGVTFPIADSCEHMADALAAIEAGLKTEEFRSLLALLRQFGPKAA